MTGFKIDHFPSLRSMRISEKNRTQNVTIWISKKSDYDGDLVSEKVFWPTTIVKCAKKVSKINHLGPNRVSIFGPPFWRRSMRKSGHFGDQKCGPGRGGVEERERERGDGRLSTSCARRSGLEAPESIYN